MMRGPRFPRGSPPMIVADANGRVVYDERGFRAGNTLNSEERENALPISVNCKMVGYLAGAARAQFVLAPGEQDFLDELRRTLLIAAFAASGLGIVLGLVVSRTLTAPLAELASAARAFASRDWNRRVAEKGTEESKFVRDLFSPEDNGED